jgi:hypothetical protein
MFIRDEVGEVARRGRFAIENYPTPEGIVSHNRNTWRCHLSIAALVMVVCRTITETIPNGHSRYSQGRDRVLIAEALDEMELTLVPFKFAHWIRVLRSGLTFGFHPGLYMASFTAELMRRGPWRMDDIPMLPHGRMDENIPMIRRMDDIGDNDDPRWWLMDLQEVVLNILLHAGYDVQQQEPYVVVEDD